MPVVNRPRAETLLAVEQSLPLLDAAGIDHVMVNTIANPYISAARSIMLRKALDAQVDKVVFLDHDLSWRPRDLLTLIESGHDVVGGTYRFKTDKIEYMGQLITDDDGSPKAAADGSLLAHSMPAGFLVISRMGINRFARNWPELLYGEACSPHMDLFNHGAHDGVWYGEDYAFCRRWRERCGQCWIIPDLDITHWDANGKPYEGNYHTYLQHLPGGAMYVVDTA